MQNHKNNHRLNKRVGGFTLTEMIVVIAIIGILAAILAPTMSSYYTMSRVKDANADAKMVFNAAQTEMQKHINIDRMAGTAGVFAGAVIVEYREDGTIRTTDGVGLNSAPVDVTGSANEAMYQELAENINKVVSDAQNINWAICVENYVVKGCFSADSLGTNFIDRCSANKSDGTRPESTDRSSFTYQTAMNDGTALANFTEEFYGLVGY